MSLGKKVLNSSLQFVSQNNIFLKLELQYTLLILICNVLDKFL